VISQSILRDAWVASERYQVQVIVNSESVPSTWEQDSESVRVGEASNSEPARLPWVVDSELAPLHAVVNSEQFQLDMVLNSESDRSPRAVDFAWALRCVTVNSESGPVLEFVNPYSRRVQMIGNLNTRGQLVQNTELARMQLALSSESAESPSVAGPEFVLVNLAVNSECVLVNVVVVVVVNSESALIHLFVNSESIRSSWVMDPELVLVNLGTNSESVLVNLIVNSQSTQRP
jgi:hypothetical protein